MTYMLLLNCALKLIEEIIQLDCFSGVHKNKKFAPLLSDFFSRHIWKEHLQRNEIECHLYSHNSQCRRISGSFVRVAWESQRGQQSYLFLFLIFFYHWHCQTVGKQLGKQTHSLTSSPKDTTILLWWKKIQTVFVV